MKINVMHNIIISIHSFDQNLIKLFPGEDTHLARGEFLLQILHRYVEKRIKRDSEREFNV